MNIAERHVNDGFVYVVVALSIDFPFHGHLGHIRVSNEGNGRQGGEVTCQTYIA